MLQVLLQNVEKLVRLTITGGKKKKKAMGGGLNAAIEKVKTSNNDCQRGQSC